MLISHAHRFALIRTRKTAGTSVEMALQPLVAPGLPVAERQPAMETPHGVVGARLIPAREATTLDRAWPPHLRASEMARRLGPAWDGLLKVTTVRDPFDRMVSAFHWERRSRGHAPLARAEEVAAFRAYVASGWWEDDRATLEVDGRLAVDVALRHERLADDLAALARRLGAPGLALPHAKRTGTARGAALADYYDAPTAGVVRDRLGWAFEAFGYPTEPGAAQDAACSGRAA